MQLTNKTIFRPQSWNPIPVLLILLKFWTFRCQLPSGFDWKTQRSGWRWRRICTSMFSLLSCPKQPTSTSSSVRQDHHPRILPQPLQRCRVLLQPQTTRRKIPSVHFRKIPTRLRRDPRPAQVHTGKRPLRNFRRKILPPDISPLSREWKWQRTRWILYISNQ